MAGNGSGDDTLASLAEAYGFESEGRLRRSRTHSSLRMLVLEH